MSQSDMTEHRELTAAVERDDLIEIRCLWQRTDYGYIGLLVAARGYGGRQLGSYQDTITDERFLRVRDHEHQANPAWPLVESVIKVSAASVEALFTDGTEIAEEDHRS